MGDLKSLLTLDQAIIVVILFLAIVALFYLLRKHEIGCAERQKDIVDRIEAIRKESKSRYDDLSSRIGSHGVSIEEMKSKVGEIIGYIKGKDSSSRHRDG